MLIEEWSLSGDKGLVGVIYMETWGGGGGGGPNNPAFKEGVVLVEGLFMWNAMGKVSEK